MENIKTIKDIDEFIAYFIERNIENLSFDLEEEIISKGEYEAYRKAEQELYAREASYLVLHDDEEDEE